jgi:predicted O-methyltransferase YrrM
MELKIMMTADEISLLKEVVSSLSENSVILEIGTAWGGSAKAMAESNPLVKIFTIDLFEDSIRFGKSVLEMHSEVSKNLSEFSNITVMCGNAMRDFPDWNTDIDVYFEDGAHKDPSLATNLTRWTSFLKPNGFLLMHDHNNFCPDVGKNIDKLISSGEFTIVKTVGSLTVLKRKEK